MHALSQRTSISRSKPASRLSSWISHLRVDSVYLALALFFGVLSVFLVPPFQTPDENSHFYRMWSFAKGQIVVADDSTVVLPQSIVELPKALGSGMIDWTQSWYSVRNTAQYLTRPIDGPPTRVFNSAGGYGPIGYLPGIAAAQATRVAGRSPLASLYLGRILNLLTAVLMTYFAIRVAPFGKGLFALVGLFPMTLSQYASLGPDALAISGALLFVALTLRYAQRRAIGRWDVVLLAVSAALLLNAKPGYQLLALLVFLVPLAAFGGRRRYALSTLAVLGAVAVLALIPMLLAPSDNEAIAELWGPGYQGHPGQQIAFVLQHPWAFVRVLAATFDTYTMVLLQQSVGVLGWLTIFLPQTVMALCFIGAGIVLSYREPMPLLGWQRGVLLGVALLSILTVTAALYIGSTATAAPLVSGLQGRYYLPFLPLLFLSFYRLRPRPWMLKAAYVAIGALGAFAAIYGMARFYY